MEDLSTELELADEDEKIQYKPRTSHESSKDASTNTSGKQVQDWRRLLSHLGRTGAGDARRIHRDPGGGVYTAGGEAIDRSRRDDTAQGRAVCQIRKADQPRDIRKSFGSIDHTSPTEMRRHENLFYAEQVFSNVCCVQVDDGQIWGVSWAAVLVTPWNSGRSGIGIESRQRKMSYYHQQRAVLLCLGCPLKQLDSPSISNSFGNKEASQTLPPPY